MGRNIYSKFSIVLLLYFQISLQISLDEFVSLTSSQKAALDQFRDAVSSKLPHEYMREDVYLMRWLREQNFDVLGATNRVLKDIQWREDNDIDHILQEDWSDYDREFRVLVEGCDKTGRPVLSLPVGDWDLRRAIVAGQSDRLMRYFSKLYEEAAMVTRWFQKNEQRAVQATMIFDMGNFNLIQQGCARCIPIFFHILAVYEQHYPYFAHRCIAINTPEFALPIYDIFKGILSKHSTEILHIFGRNKKKWGKFLMEEIDESQLSKNLGGINVETLDYGDFRGMNTSLYTCAYLDSLRN
ncbi:SEC14-like protein 2 [Folsomia candida]|uniref:SEC14-like protein 2 n=1 Tax=Folsomia candida TaxID=158441 RepID=UPI0016054E05|nr:SEC14-like protein 2 [Folsomia candida]XP_035712429.1 SEC14-like protein 2 [Folsomia candida]XP_035712430.1 SEC14-like protein 2 [Folsomia candida]XP_035712431.1 SEC14-like protein 2 [Folsomia candida]XP_035712432.1 SEC14-like protein 2 [Folsomia candida]